MTLSSMRFKNYVWPHNPRVYEILYSREVTSHKIPFGLYTLQNAGRSHRVLRGEGEFAGAGAYDEFKRLATVFYEETPGLLVHPLWQPSKAYFVSLSLRQEPEEDFVSYAFEFWECFEGENSSLTTLRSSSAEVGGGAESDTEERLYTVVAGDTLWAIAMRNGLSLPELLALNPGIKNPNLIYAGDIIRLS